MYEPRIYTEADYILFLYHLRGRNGPKPTDPPVKAEVTYERDLVLLRKHRDWGFNVPAEDIDFLEYDRQKAVALFEYKRKRDWDTASIVFDSNLKAMIDLGDRARLPVFLVFYSPTRDRFRVFPINDYAHFRTI